MEYFDNVIVKLGMKHYGVQFLKMNDHLCIEFMDCETGKFCGIYKLVYLNTGEENEKSHF